MSHIRILCLLNLELMLLFLTILPVQAESRPVHVRKVLLLNSYHKGYNWSDRLMAGAQELLEEKKQNIELYIEFMDTKRMISDEYMQLLFETYKLKYSEIMFDAVISFDDNALQFMLKYHDRLFKGVPVVFAV